MFYALVFIIFATRSFTCMTTSFNDDDDTIGLSHLNPQIFGKPIENEKKIWNTADGNPEEQGPYVEGDLLFPTEGRNGIKAESSRWKNGEVPFEINGQYNAFNMDLIERALNEYHKNTCIKFIPRRSSDRDYISIEDGNSGCWSSVGRVGGKQVVNLQAQGCVTKIGTVIHELLHAIGFFHEQNREDRDKFVTINSRNIKQGYEVNFAKAKAGETTAFGVTYDYGSVLHYSATAFSRNGQPTIEAKMKTNDKMGQREGFSKRDIEKVNKMYKCQGVTGTPVDKPTTTPKPPNGSIIGSIFETLFPSSDMDVEEIVEE